MQLGVPKETVEGERRVALVPDLIGKLVESGLEVALQASAGEQAGFPDRAYAEKGARITADAVDAADIVLTVQPPAVESVGRMKSGATLIGLLRPYSNASLFEALASGHVTSFTMELMPRITRAQSMDALSAMSTVAGYKAVLLAADRLPKFFPLLMTAAGTVTPARVFVVGAGVAGLQAIGTAHRLGAVVEAYDTRPAVKEQVESLGARFVEMALDTKDSEAKTGYAQAQSEEFYAKQQQLMAKSVAAADVVITTALVPGKPAPRLINEEMVRAMRPGSVIVDLAAEQGGNCVATEPGKDVVVNGVLVCGPLNLPASVPFHASQMYARTVTNFVLHLVRGGMLTLDLTDELTRGPLVTHQGRVVHETVKTAMGAAKAP